MLTVGSLLAAICAAAIGIYVYWSFQQMPASFRTAWTINGTYDYIVVGGGTAGCVLAARLSTNPDVSVLLIEAGDEPPFLANIPGYSPFLQKTNIDWQYETVPQKHALRSMVNNRATWPQGKVLGGSSSLHHLVYQRGLTEDFQRWTELGNEGWTYDEVLPYFMKSERTRIPEFKESDAHGHRGPVNVSWSLGNKFAQLILQAAKSAGFVIEEDHTTNKRSGFSRSQQFAFEGKRQSSFTNFLLPAIGRSNLHVLPNALVTRILVANGRAFGVYFSISTAYDPKKLHDVKARNEVILAAGAIRSPQLLMLSGLGPEEHLRDLNITVVRSLPAVGRKLKDQIALELVLAYDGDDLGSGHQQLQSWFGWAMALKNFYWANRPAPLNSSMFEVVGQMFSGLSNDLRPDLQLHFASSAGIFHNLRNLEPGIAATSLRDIGATAASVFIVLLHTSTAGVIELASRNPFHHPRIDPNYLADEEDVNSLLKGIKTVLRILDQEPLKQFNFRVKEELLPGCPKLKKFDDDELLKCFIRHQATSFHQASGTCGMGPSDNQSVVDDKFRVHGIRGLRVVDASVFPDQISGGNAATVLMLAERATDFIIDSEEGLE